MRNIILSVIAMALALAGSQAIAESALDRIRESGVIRVAIDLSVPPWSYKGSDLRPTGSEVETAELLAETLGVEMRIMPTNGANRIPFLLSGQADVIISALSITDERKNVVDFTRPYSGAATFVAGPKSVQINDAVELSGKRIAVTRGTANDTDLTAIAPADAEIVRFEDEATTITAVASGQVELVAQAQSLIDVINQRNPALQLEPKLTLRDFRVGMAVRKGDSDFLGYLDRWIIDNLRNGKLSEIYTRHQHAELPIDILEGIQSQ
ncbi:transporter substrate-binding domain-containing protein (plasmid) [Paracoccus sp. TD-10]|uniref:transporter substrate-binding domain-containing protein n=1 Tax=Paracoccus sp. TD-10 TaxID=3395918 RepID=UPI003AAC1062